MEVPFLSLCDLRQAQQRVLALVGGGGAVQTPKHQPDLGISSVFSGSVAHRLGPRYGRTK